MARTIALVFVVTLATVIGIAVGSSRGFVGASGSAIQNGDTNGDGAINIADAVYLLSYMFDGGPGPVAIAAGPQLTAEQAEILSHLSLVDIDNGEGGTAKTIRFTGVNVQIVNGLGATNGYPAHIGSTDPSEIVSNSLGNLIVGYNEFDPNITLTPTPRTGSHNVIVGFGHAYSSVGGACIGYSNYISGPYGTVAAGHLNVSAGFATCVAGGHQNQAAGDRTVICGGIFGTSDGGFSTLVGGQVRSVTEYGDCRMGSILEDN